MSDPEKSRAGLSNSSLARTEDGISTIEYLIVLVLLAAVVVGTWKTFGSSSEEGTTHPSVPSGTVTTATELTTR